MSGRGISWAICKSASHSRQTTMPAPTTQFLQAGCPSCRPTNSVEALKVSRNDIKTASKFQHLLGEVVLSNSVTQHSWFLWQHAMSKLGTVSTFSHLEKRFRVRRSFTARGCRKFGCYQTPSNENLYNSRSP